MRALCTVALALEVILNSIEISSQFEYLPNGDPFPGIPRGAPSSPNRHHLQERFHSSVKPSVRVRARSPQTRCRILPSKIVSSDGRGYRLDQLEFIRLIPNTNPHRLFLLQRYIFPVNAKIKLRLGRHKYGPIPAQVHIVLSAPDGDVFAILESSNIFAGLYGGDGYGRMKINMESGKTAQMTHKEIRETPVGEVRRISCNFRVERVR